MSLPEQPPGSNRPPKVVVIDDDPAVAPLTVEVIRAGIRGVEVALTDLDAGTFAELIARADVCVCSGGVRPHGAFDTLGRLLLMRPELPVVVLLRAFEAVKGSDGESEGRVEEAIRLGAADVILRGPGGLAQLPIAIRRIVMHRAGAGYAGQRSRRLHAALADIEADNRKLRSLVARLESLAATDPLTGLLNRRALDAALVRAFAASKRYGHELSCLALDVDGFKGVNDALGHAYGDELLRVLASAIVAECRLSDVAGRLGGDEFVVLLPHTGPAEAAAVAQRLRRRFGREAGNLDAGTERGPRVGLSIGVSSRMAHGLDSPEAVLEAADGALYEAKRAGRDTVRTAVAGASASGVRRAG